MTKDDIIGISYSANLEVNAIPKGRYEKTFDDYIDEEIWGKTGPYYELDQEIVKGIDAMKVGEGYYQSSTFKTTDKLGSEISVKIGHTAKYSQVSGYYVTDVKTGSRDIGAIQARGARSGRDLHRPVFATLEKAKSFAKRVLVSNAEQNLAWRENKVYD